MAFFTETQAAQAAAHDLILVALVEFEFENETMRLWTGDGIIDIDGEEWVGTGILGSISAVQFGENDVADKITFQLSGVSSDLIAEVSDPHAYRGKDVTIYGQFLDGTTGGTLDSKFVVRPMIMDVMGYGAKGATDRSISLSSETIWTSRNLSAFAAWSDQDQQTRFPGDLGCQFVPTLKSKKLAWPTF